MANLRVVTLDGSKNQIEDAELQEFRNGLKGDSLVANDEGYDVARTVWNGSIDKQPAIIVQCSGVADVIESVNFARKHDLLIAVRGGSHNVAGNSVCEGGLVIDMGPMTGVKN